MSLKQQNIVAVSKNGSLWLNNARVLGDQVISGVSSFPLQTQLFHCHN